MDDIVNAAYRQAVEARIAALWKHRAWYRTHHGWIIGSKIENERELRALVKVAREARKLAALAQEEVDKLAKQRYEHNAYRARNAEWTPGEYLEAYGR